MNIFTRKKAVAARFAARLKRFISPERQDPPAPQPRRFEIPLAHVWEIRMLADLYCSAPSGDHYLPFYLLRGAIERVFPEFKGLKFRVAFPSPVRVEVVEILNP